MQTKSQIVQKPLFYSDTETPVYDIAVIGPAYHSLYYKYVALPLF
jgi:hypothetical protein